MICSLCGITFASGVDPDKIQMLEDWALSLEASASLDPESSGDPFESEPEVSEAMPDPEPEPTDFSFTDVRPSDVDDPGFADVPGGDVEQNRKSKSPGGNICTRKIPTIKKLPNSRKKAPKKR